MGAVWIDAIKSKGYTYSSIEYHDNYQDNETGRKYDPRNDGRRACDTPLRQAA
jgi:hypothetical protein